MLLYYIGLYHITLYLLTGWIYVYIYIYYHCVIRKCHCINCLTFFYVLLTVPLCIIL